MQKSKNKPPTTLFMAYVSRPLINSLKIKDPIFHFKKILRLEDGSLIFGETVIINNRCHIVLSEKASSLWSEFFLTIAHELIHCWQFTFQIHCNGEVFNPFECESHAYALEPLAAVALAAAFLSDNLKQESKQSRIA